MVRASHVVATAGMTMAFILAAIAAFKLLRHNHKEDRTYHTKALNLSMIVGFINTVLSMIAGDLSAKFYTKFNQISLQHMSGIMIRNLMRI